MDGSSPEGPPDTADPGQGEGDADGLPGSRRPDDGDAYEADRAQRAAALVTAGGLVALIAGVVVTLTRGGCIVPRTDAFGYACQGAVTEPWFGLLALVTVGAAAVGSVLGIRDLGRDR